MERKTSRWRSHGHKNEKNICEPRAEVIGLIADALGTTSDFLIGRTLDPTPPERSSERELRLAREIELVRKFRRLSCDSKARLEERLEALLEAQEREM